MTYKSLKMIAISEKNYLTLKRLGSAGDSFNDVITEVLKHRNLQAGPDRATNSKDQNAAKRADTTTLERDYTEYE
jgi:predicted CopG family antitoxin